MNGAITMKRQEFETVLKRALELQNQQKQADGDSFELENLKSAAARLGISDEILEQALNETQTKRRQCHFNDTPQKVREDFLKHFLLNESNPAQQNSAAMVDHESLDNPSKPIRIFHPLHRTVEALVEIKASDRGGTEVSWRSYNDLPLKTVLLFYLWPLLILVPVSASAMSQGTNLLGLIPIAVIFFFSSAMMHWGIRHNAGRLERTVENYFRNAAALKKIEEQNQPEPEAKKASGHAQQKIHNFSEDVLKQPLSDAADENTGTAASQPGQTIKD
jgi:hypothetical protein